MAASYRVIVSCTLDEDNDRVYRCSGSVTAEAILERWTKELDLPLDAANLRRPNGAFYRPQEALFRPGAVDKMAEVVAEFCCRVRVSLGAEKVHEVSASPSATPRELLGPLRAAFGLSDSRPMRLTLGATALLPDEGLAAQGVQMGQENQLQLELGFVGRVTEAVSGFLRPFLLFSSEPAGRLAEPWLPAECCVQARGPAGALTAVSMEGDVEAALGQLEDAEAVQLELEVRQGVAVLAACHPRPQVVPAWASTAVGSLLSALEPPPKPLPQPSLMGGVLVPLSEAVRAGEGAVLAAESMPVKLWLKRRCRVLRLPCHSVVADLRAAATEALDLPPNGEQKAELRIKKGRAVESEEDPRPLAAFCVEHGDSFCASKPPPLPRTSVRPQLSVHLANGLQFDFPLASGEVLRFGDVVSRLAAATGKPRADFRFRVFRCRGCGRGLEVEEEAFQVMPAPCCRQRSLRLTEKRVASVGVQNGPPASRRCDRETNTSRVKNNTKDASVSAHPKSVDKSVGGGPKMASRTSATQTKKSEPEAGRNLPEQKPRAPKPAQVPPQALLPTPRQMPPQMPPQMPLQMPPQPPLQMPPQMPPQVPPQPPRQPPRQMPPQMPPQMPLQMPPQVPPQPPRQMPPQMPPQVPPKPPRQAPQNAPRQPPLPMQPPFFLQFGGPEQQREVEAMQQRDQQKRQQQLEVDQLMALNPGLPLATAQHREALEVQLGIKAATVRSENDKARDEFQKLLRKEQETVERQRLQALQQEAEEEIGAQARAAARSDLVHKAKEPQFIQKFKQAPLGRGRHFQRTEYIPARQEDYRPRARQRQPETRQEKRQRRLQELREQFDAERQELGAAAAAGPPGAFHHFFVTSLIRGRPDFNCRLQLPAAPRVADLRREMGLEIEVPPARLRLRRCSILRGDRRLYRIFKNHPANRVFAGPDGASFVADLTTKTEMQFLENDNEPFVLVPGEMCMLEVSCQR